MLDFPENPQKIYLGDTEVAKLYQGDILLFENSPIVPYDDSNEFGNGDFSNFDPGLRWDVNTGTTPSGNSRPTGPWSAFNTAYFVYWEGSASNSITGDLPLTYIPDITPYVNLRIEFAWVWSVSIEDAGGVNWPDNADGIAPKLQVLIDGVWTTLFSLTRTDNVNEATADRSWNQESIAIPDEATSLRFVIDKTSALNVWNSDPSFDSIRITNQP